MLTLYLHQRLHPIYHPPYHIINLALVECFPGLLNSSIQSLIDLLGVLYFVEFRIVLDNPVLQRVNRKVLYSLPSSALLRTDIKRENTLTQSNLDSDSKLVESKS